MMRERRIGKIEIAPSLLSADFARLADDIGRVEAAGCRVLHLDVMDGHFVPNLTIGPVVAAAIRRVTSLRLGAHLMIEEPERYLSAFSEAGVDEITIHQEIAGDFAAVIREIKRLGLRAGVSTRPGTAVEKIVPVLGDVDLVLVMSVEPGFGGQAFLPGSEERIAETRRLADATGREITVAVDGGITVKTAPLASAAGAEELIAGSAVFSGNIQENIAALRAAVSGC
jgi:ribulose-phosphate 3-epimerase